MSQRLTPNQQKVLDFLKVWHGIWVAPTLIGHEVGGRTHSSRRRHSSWASPICKRLVELGLVERNDNGYYRYKQG